MPAATTPRHDPDARWAVVIVTTRTAGSGDDGYQDTADRMMELATNRDGFLGVDSIRGADGRGITVSYWRDPEATAAWKADAEHLEAQRRGVSEWYSAYTIDAGWMVRTAEQPPSGS